jgi:signal transduction histidine kinase
MRLRSLTTRFLLTLSLSAVLPTLVLGYFAAAQARQQLHERSVELNVLGPAGRSADRLREQLVAVRGTFARLYGIAESHLDGELTRAEFATRIDDEFEVGTVQLERVVLVDSAGDVQQTFPSFDVLGAGWQRMPRTVVDESWFEQIQDPAHRRFVIWLSRHLSPFRHGNPERSSQDPSDYSFGVVAALPDRDGGRAALLALFNWALIQDVLDATVRDMRERTRLASAEGFVLSASRREVLAHSDRGRYGEPPNERIARARVGQNDAVRVELPAEHDERGRVVRGLRSAVLAPTSDPGNFGWWLGIVVDDAELDMEGRTFFRLVLSLTAATAVLLVFWSLIASRAITRPINRLVAATEAVRRGEFGVRVETRGHGDEIAELGGAFNRMSEELAESRDLLSKAERRAAWAEMARQVAHEIKNPLTPMRMGAQLALRARADGDPRWDALSERLARTVLDQTDELRRIADDFRAFAGPATPSDAEAGGQKRDVVSAARLLREVADGFRAIAEVRGVRFEVSVDPAAEDAVVACDPGAIRRLLWNLVQNALDALAAGGEDEASVRAEQRVGVSLSIVEDDVAFAVEDDGPGIPDEVRARLFEPYFTTRSSGTGLGLAICSRIAEEHDGVVELVEPGPPRTVFRVRLPRAPGA